MTWSNALQAQKFSQQNLVEDDDLEEESMLETPLDKVEPYTIFKDTLFGKQRFFTKLPMLTLVSSITKHPATALSESFETSFLK